MATAAADVRRDSAAPQPLDYALAIGALLLLVAVVTAFLRGMGDLAYLPFAIQLHIATILPALALTPVMLVRRRGDRPHRWLGYAWVSLMVVTASASFFIPEDGTSWIFILSGLTLYTCLRIVTSARAHDWRAHRGHVRRLVGGALLLAGFFTFQFDRMMGVWLEGGSILR